MGLLDKKSAQINIPDKTITQRVELMKMRIEKLDDPNLDLDSMELTTLDQSKIYCVITCKTWPRSSKKN